MYTRPEDERAARGACASTTRFDVVQPESRSERVREIRLRIAQDAYRTEAVVDEIARRILMGREL